MAHLLIERPWILLQPNQIADLLLHYLHYDVLLADDRVNGEHAVHIVHQGRYDPGPVTLVPRGQLPEAELLLSQPDTHQLHYDLLAALEYGASKFLAIHAQMLAGRVAYNLPTAGQPVHLELLAPEVAQHPPELVLIREAKI